jgi:CheY-like chemotaxis protein
MAHAERLNVQQPGAPELAAIQRGSWYLLTLVENLLEQARMGEGGRSLELASVDVMALLRDMQELFSIQACSKGLTFSVSNPDEVQYVYADDLRLRQVLVNLLSNAVRYTLEGGIRLQCRRLGDAIEFCVSDTGKGIDKADIQRIFQPFTRVNPAGEGGAGLGLTISQQLVAAMHGELNVQSQPGKGSTFCFSLPAGTVALSETTESLQGLRVVLLEDDNDIREMYQIWLEDWGAVVRGFTSCERAIAEFNDYPTDLVLTDLFLEDGNGMDLLKILRETNPNVATVVCSGSDNIGASCEDEKELVDCFISKPVSASRLESAIQSVVRTRRNK